jgi:hypothetical protein
MQASFSFTRLGLLIRKQWADHSRFYVLATAAIFGLMALAFYTWSITNDTDVAHTYIFLVVGLFLGGSIFASMIFADLSQRTTGIYWLSVPATHAEKLICAILYSQVFFNAVVLVIFFLLRSVTLSVIHLSPHMFFRNSAARESFSLMVMNVAFGYFSLQSLFLLGSVYFQRFSFIKTVVSGVLVILLFFLFIRYFVMPVLPVQVSVESLTRIQVQEEGGVWATYSLPGWVSSTLRYASQYIWMPVFWAATYFRLKEKEL